MRSQGTTSHQYCVVWIDHDPSIQDIVNNIGSLALKDGRDLSEEIRFESLVVRPDGNPVSEITDGVARLGIAPDLLLVDLSFGSGADHKKDVKAGRQLAKQVRQAFFPAPVGLYTRSEATRSERLWLYSDSPALFVEDIRKFCEYDPALSGDEWKLLIEKIIKATSAESRSGIIPHRMTRDIKWEDGHPLSKSRGLRIAAPALVERCLAYEVDSGQVSLRQLGGGFSGSFVIVATVSSGKSFVVKIDEDPDQIRREYAGYSRIGSTLSSEHYLPVPPGSTGVHVLSDLLWGAFLMEFGSRAQPLLELSGMPGNVLATLYQRVWSECLLRLYQPIKPIEVSVEEVLQVQIAADAHASYQVLARYSGRLSLLDSSLLRHAQRWREPVVVDEFRDLVARIEPKIECSGARAVHGDLNCRNILVDEHGGFKLIDFPNVAAGSLATDFVKAECELVFLVLDWVTGYDGDFERLSVWARLTHALSIWSTLDTADFGDSELARVSAAIREIRVLFRAHCRCAEEDEKAYILYLCSRALKYAAYTDITPAKRFLALIWASQLLENFVALPSEPPLNSSE